MNRLKYRVLSILLITACLLPAGLHAGPKYYLVYYVPGEKYPVEWGGWKTLSACQQHMAKLAGKAGRPLINPVCVKRRGKKK